MNFSNKNQTKLVLITGAACRVGAALAEYFHQSGYDVFIHYHHSFDEARTLAEKLNHLRPNSVEIYGADLTLPDTPKKLMTKVRSSHQRLDVLVNNASVFLKDTSHFDAAFWQTLWATNVEAPMRLSLAAHPLLQETQGCIINLTDIHANKPLKGYGVYCQTKAALWMQTQSLAKEFAPMVRVNAVAPGAVAWPQGENTLSLAQKEKIIEKTLLKRHGTAMDIAKAVLYLAESPFVTGQQLMVDGGRHLS